MAENMRITPSEGVRRMQECGTPSEGVKNLQAAETSKYVLWLGYGGKHADYSFGRSEKSAGCGNVEIRLIAGVWRKTCGLLLRKESLKRGDYRLLRKE